MTKRNEKPSPSESSTDTLIASLLVGSERLNEDRPEDYYLIVVAMYEAAKRLDRLEREIETLRNK